MKPHHTCFPSIIYWPPHRMDIHINWSWKNVFHWLYQTWTQNKWSPIDTWWVSVCKTPCRYFQTTEHWYSLQLTQALVTISTISWFFCRIPIKKANEYAYHIPYAQRTWILVLKTYWERKWNLGIHIFAKICQTNDGEAHFLHIKSCSINCRCESTLEVCPNFLSNWVRWVSTTFFELFLTSFNNI